MSYFPLAFLCALALVPRMAAQPRVDFMNMHERIIAVVPVIGSGTYEDPKRPLFAPSGKESVPGLISWSWQASDDGKLAIDLLARGRGGHVFLDGSGSWVPRSVTMASIGRSRESWGTRSTSWSWKQTPTSRGPPATKVRS